MSKTKTLRMEKHPAILSALNVCKLHLVETAAAEVKHIIITGLREYERSQSMGGDGQDALDKLIKACSQRLAVFYLFKVRQLVMVCVYDFPACKSAGTFDRRESKNFRDWTVDEEEEDE